MSSLRHSEPPALTSDDALLDAARDSILAVGWRRTTLTEVARRAGVSRMTLYRRWPDMQTLLADLMTREWGLLALPEAGDATDDRPALERLAAGVSRIVAGLRGNALFAQILHLDPELLLPYLLDRRGRSQDALLGVLVQSVVEGQRDRSVRPGSPTVLARSVLLATYGWVLSARTMTDADVSVESLDAELRLLVERFLAP
jgi:AcrR family transcriptional regulator